MSTTNTIAVHEFADRCRLGDVELIDVRTPLEFREKHAAAALNIPLDKLDPQQIMSDRNGSAESPLYVICKSGKRAEQACQKFMDAGFDNVVSVEGGTEAWASANLPTVHGKKAISLERQVRIAAGSIVLVGALLALFVHPYWVGICGFVGAGLIFAGVTDNCAMGMLIAKMPWNRSKDDSSTV